MPLSTPPPGGIVAALTGALPAAGEYVPDRDLWTAIVPSPTTSGAIAATFWTADKSEPINNVRVTTAATAAGATPTLCRMGIYSVDSTGAMTALLAACANDTTLFAAANTAYTRALTSTFNKVAGVRYATTLLVVSAAAIPTFVGHTAASATGSNWAEMFELPQKCARITGQADLGASYAYGAQASWPYRIGFTLT